MRTVIVDVIRHRLRQTIHKIFVVGFVKLSACLIVTLVIFLDCRKLIIHPRINDSYGNALPGNLIFFPDFISMHHGNAPLDSSFIRLKDFPFLPGFFVLFHRSNEFYFLIGRNGNDIFLLCNFI